MSKGQPVILRVAVLGLKNWRRPTLKLRNEFINDVQSFVDDSGIHFSYVGLQALNNPAFWFKFHTKGGDLKLSTVDKVYAFMEKWYAENEEKDT